MENPIKKLYQKIDYSLYNVNRTKPTAVLHINPQVNGKTTWRQLMQLSQIWGPQALKQYISTNITTNDTTVYQRGTAKLFGITF